MGRESEGKPWRNPGSPDVLGAARTSPGTRLWKGVSRRGRKIKHAIGIPFSDDYIIGAWFPVNNWGDALNPYLMHWISGKKVVHFTDVYRVERKPVYSVIGSVVGNYALPNLTIWGSGFIRPNGTLKARPRAVTAVRGPLTRNRLMELGVDCPAVYGDPALLLPRFVRPRSERGIYKLGIIPHFVERRSPALEVLKARDDVLIIDICGEIEKVVDDVWSCRMIASSSLHGIICADAYGVPNAWIKLSGRVIGEGFKFRDYDLSVGRPVRKPLVVTAGTTMQAIESACEAPRMEIDLDALYRACPFRPN